MPTGFRFSTSNQAWSIAVTCDLRHENPLEPLVYLLRRSYLIYFTLCKAPLAITAKDTETFCGVLSKYFSCDIRIHPLQCVWQQEWGTQDSA